eukprot:gene18347-20890_t
MLRQVLLRRKYGLSSSLLQAISALASPSGLSSHFTTYIKRPKTLEERIETDYYAKVMKAHDEAESKEAEEEEEVTVIDRLFRYKPLKNRDEDDEDPYEGRPEKTKPSDYLLESGDPDPKMLVGKSLLSLGKIHYRHSETLPPWFLDKQEQLSSHRTAPQIRKCLKDWMIKNDQEVLAKYRKKALKWGHAVSAKDKTEVNTYGPDESIAYAHYFLSSRFGIVTRVLGEIKTLHPDFKPSKVLDYGCGPATGGACVHHVYNDSEFRYTGVDISQSMIDSAKIMTSNMLPNTTFYTSSGELVKHALNTNERFDLIIASFTINELQNDPSRRIATQLLFELLDTGGYLVIIESGNPLGSHTVRTARQFLLDAFNNVDASGRTTEDAPSLTFFDRDLKQKMIDKKAQEEESDSDFDSEDEEEERGHKNKQDKFSQKKAFMNRKQASRADRDKRREQKRLDTEQYKIVEMMLPPPKKGGYSYEDLGAYVVAPCTHDRPCPLATGVWCSFSQKVYSGVIRKASEEKFSYLVMQKRPKNSAANFVTTVNAKKGSKKNDPHSAARSTIFGTVQKQRGKWGGWLESTPYEGDGHSNSNLAEEAGDSPAALLDAVRNPTPLSVLQRFMETRNPTEVTDLVDTFIDEVDWEEYDPPLYREEWGRLVRSPIKSKGHITLDVCTPEGQVARSVISRSNLQHVPALFTALRKTTWGGLFPVISSNLERSNLSKNAKGTRYLGNAERDKGSQVLFDKFSNTKSPKVKATKESKVEGSTSKGSKFKSTVPLDADSDSESYAAQAAQSIPGLKPGMVPSNEMIAASKSARYRRLLEAQAMREEEEEERALAAQKRPRGGDSNEVTQESGEKEGSGRSRGRGRGVSAQLERLKAKRAQKEAEGADA